ncbi:MAG: deoxyribodipyrimidine photo-lyase, partial [Myxococcota bacterium]
MVDRQVRPAGRYVLYWMTAARRTRWSFALQHACLHADALGLPLVVFEPLGLNHRWASARFHQFVIEGMRDNAARCAAAGVAYVPWVETGRGEGRGVLAELAGDAALVVTDDTPIPTVRNFVRRAAEWLPARLEAVDGNGVLPLDQPGRTFTMAVHFRRHLQKSIRAHLGHPPVPDPLAQIERPPFVLGPRPSWRPTDLDAVDLDPLPIDHAVVPVAYPGGAKAGEAVLAEFIAHRLHRYGTDRNRVDDSAASGLSPYLHFG